jgi:hypothetical protein
MSERVSNLATICRTWADRFIHGILVALCVVIVLFLGGQAIEFGWKGMVEAVSKASWVAKLGCDLVSSALKSRYVPDYLKARELGIRYKTGCARDPAS